MRIGRTYRFEAAHHLPLVPDGHKCKNMHGHNYLVRVVIEGELDSRGFVVDFAELDAVLEQHIKRLDHGVLNDVIENPTAENIALWIRQKIPYDKPSVRVYENDDCWAEITN